MVASMFAMRGQLYLSPRPIPKSVEETDLPRRLGHASTVLGASSGREQRARAARIHSPLVASGARAISLSRLRRPWTPGQGSPRRLPVWSIPAALRAVRTTLVMPTLFVISYKVIGNVQMATFAAFGSFATLVLA